MTKMTSIRTLNGMPALGTANDWNKMSCECYQIGGRFIAEDPDCPAHGTEAQRRQATTFHDWWNSLSYDERLAITDGADEFSLMEAAFEAGKALA